MKLRNASKGKIMAVCGIEDRSELSSAFSDAKKMQKYI